MSATSSSDFSSRMQLLALCPLLAVSDTVANALGLGVAVLLTVPPATVATLLIRRWLGEEGALAAGLLLLAGAVATVELVMRAWFQALRESLDIFLPLIVANLAIVTCIVEAVPARREAVRCSVKLASGTALTLLILGIARELVGRGSLLHDAGRLLGAWAGPLETNIFRVDMGFLLAMLPPGAFIALGLLIAARNGLREHRSSHS